MSRNLVDIALTYAERGWPVLPLHTPSNGNCSCGISCKSPGKHPRIKGGVHAASRDFETISNWWENWPRANIGIATGNASNLIVIDLDERHGGIESWRNWEYEGQSKTGLIAKTGGGFHLYFGAQGHQVKSRTSILPGVDVRAEGGYIVAVGSSHYSGIPYSWVSQENNAPSPISESLLQILERQKNSEQAAYSRHISQGRNDFLTKVAGLLRRESFDSDLIYRGIEAVNQALCAPALEQREVQQIAIGIERYSTAWGDISNPAGDLIVAPQLDSKTLPQVLRDWVDDAAERMQAPPEFFAAPCLVAFASLVGRQVGIFPKQEDTWFVVPNLWGGIVARPGLFKSPAILEATSFVRNLALKATSQYEVDCLKSEINTESIKSQIEGLKEAIKKAARDKQAESDIQEIQNKMQSLRQKLGEHNCTHKRFVVNDSTVEKIGVILKENPHGVLLLRDELAGWAASLGRREGDREFYLESWNGTGSFTVDRIGRGTLHIPNLCLSIFGGIQPSKLGMLSNGVSDGLLQRFQILVYPDAPKGWRNVDRKPREFEYQAFAEVFAKAANLTSSHSSACKGLHFSREAQEKFTSWRQDLEIKLRSGQIESEDFEAHLSKYRSLVPSLSLLFEVMRALSETRELLHVDTASIKMAIDWATYLEQHARKIYQEELSIAQKGSVLLAQKIKNGDVKDGDSVRSIYRRHWALLDTPEKLDKAITRLEECGWIRIETVTNHSGKSNVIKVNPQVHHFSLRG